MAGSSTDRSLQETPTWAVALVCAVFVIISILIEHGIHSLTKWFQKRQNKAMIEALEKIKAELMLLGFISLLLTFGTTYVAKICIPVKLGDTLLPCDKKYKGGGDSKKGGDAGGGKDDDNDNDHGRKLLSYAEEMILRRVLAASDDKKDYCLSKGKVSLISYSGVHQLHIFIFVLAVFHVLYSIIIMALGQAKMNKWKAWESETTSMEYQFTNDPERFRFAHQTSFVKRHTGLSTKPGIRWIVAFFRQIFGSISKVDYLTIRNGFISAHFAPNSKFDFHKYIKRSMEDDFKVVLGISIPLWFFAVIFLLINVYKWHTLAYLSLLPLLILLLVGTKLELVIMEMAQQIQDRETVIRGAPVVEPTNKFFWFNSPQLVLFLIHFTLFQNAFQMAFFLWTLYEFGISSCFHESIVIVILRVCLGVVLHFICSYSTFPLYALVTQMGSHMKQSIFEEQTAKALKKWSKAARDRKKVRKAGDISNASFMSGENTPSRASSPIHLLHKHMHRSSAAESEIDVAASPRSYMSDTGENTPSRASSPIHLLHKHKHRSSAAESEIDVAASPRSYMSDTDLSDIEASNHGRPSGTESRHNDHNSDFSFSKA